MTRTNQKTPVWRQSRSRLDAAHHWPALEASRIAILGAGGLGSHIVDLVSREGIAARGGILILDREMFAWSDFSRNALVQPEHAARSVGKKKAQHAARVVRRREGNARGITAEVHERRIELLITGFQPDILIDTMDNDGARLWADVLAVRTGVPVAHAGAGVSNSPDGRSAGGQVFVFNPRDPESGCLVCAGAVDLERARADLLPRHVRDERRRAGYDVEQPDIPTSVTAHLCSLIAGLAVEIIVDVLEHRVDVRARLLAFSLDGLTIMRARVPRRIDCVVCNDSSAKVSCHGARRLPRPRAEERGS